MNRYRWGAKPRYDPRAGEHLQAGLKHHQAGHLVEAEACYRRALAAQPDHAEALSNLGAALRAQGKLIEALAACRRAVALRPGYAETHCNLGNALRDQGRLDEAIAAYRRSIRIGPDVAEVHSNLGVALFAQGKLDEAIAAHRQAIGIKPNYAVAHRNLGQPLYAQGKRDEAVAAYRQAILIKADYAEAYCDLGAALHGQGKLDEAIDACRQAIVLKPDLAMAHNNLALALIERGRLSEGRAALEKAILLAPRNIKFLRNLSEMFRLVGEDPHLAALEQLLARRDSLAVSDRIDLHFAAAKAYDDVGRHRHAFREWLDGNVLKRRQVAYNETARLGTLDRVRAVFTSELIRTRQNAGHQSAVPVFIVGMPRSGSTLVEQILASHPQVFGGGELTQLSRAVHEMQTTFGGSATFPDLLLCMTDPDFRDLGARYLAEIRRLAPSATRITDKMPGNFIFAGLVHLALPKAAIIHTIRHPADTCLSCFSKLFSEEQNHTYDLAELGRYYRHYQALMAHWRRVLPAGRILDVRYEEVVADLEGQARRIIAHCGLDWTPRCLAFHQTDRPVRTASAVQVRQPIYTSAIGRWREYEPFLQPLLAELGIAGDSNGNHLAPKDADPDI
jgi:tetratricopeptide (TPR) repeat protein